MPCQISEKTLSQIHDYLETTYPEEGAGFLLGYAQENSRQVHDILLIENQWAEGSRQDRFLITAQDSLQAELVAEERGLDVIGVFHSHPDDVNRPSAFDREWALPWFSYFITSVADGKSTSSRSWRLTDDRQEFIEETIFVAQLER